MTSPFAHVNDVHAGTKLRADGGFPCIPDGAILTVLEDDGGLWVPCNEAEDYPEEGQPVTGKACGHHYLDGQLGFSDHDKGHYVGLYLA